MLPKPVQLEVDYPYADDEPMTESDWHFKALDAVRFALDTRYRDREDVYVASNLFVYYEEGDRERKVSPDTFVVLGVPKKDRKSYRIWEEGKAPDVVFEFTSESSKLTDKGTKRASYEMMGVKEYFLFDPLGEYIPEQLKGYRRHGEEFLPLIGSDLVCQTLGVRLAPEDKLLRVWDAAKGTRYLTPEEAERARQEAEHAREEAEHGRREAEQARQEAEQARQEAEHACQEAERAREVAERRARELEEELRRHREEGAG